MVGILQKLLLNYNLYNIYYETFALYIVTFHRIHSQCTT